MIRKKAKSKSAKDKKSEKTAKKRGTAKRKLTKKERESTDVRKECSKLVKAEATEITAAVIGEGKKGQLGPMKYLFEMANIFPTTDDGSQTSAREDSLAETLLNRLGIPTSPVVADEYEKESNEVIPATLAETDEQEDDGASSKVQEEESKIAAVPDVVVACE
jgi:hypothetical protein